MNRWTGKVAVVTGASSGIGAAIAKDLVKAGMVVVGLARRVECIEALKLDLQESIRSRLHAIKCDITKEEDILQSFKWAEENLGGVDVLVNNAGILPSTDLLDAGNTENLCAVLNINVLGLVICSREAYQSMKKRSVAGHIIHINSIAGHSVMDLPQLSIYPGSKHAVTAITETMRNELRNAGTKIKVTSISPGIVRTDILPEALINDDILETVDISNAVLYVLGTPPRVQIHELTIKPVGEKF
ncbi:farnesol dehydrogenase-like [Ochlerotatus camptorhynchus]|uniref:farnesol dehydrogenase-like n=1 Tax=Ochlerotatus camptorhynchus TaxID=644619 RepID=UPI0031DE8B90